MTDDDPLADLFSLPGADDIKRWEAEYRRMGEAIAALDIKRSKLARIIAAARDEATPPATTIPKRKRNGTYQAGTWTGVLAKIVAENPEGISYDALKQKVPGELGEKLRENPSTKMFYTTLRLLERDETVVRHRGHAFTPAGYKRYLDKLARGERQEIIGGEYAKSPVGDAIRAYLKQHGPTTASVLRQHLSSFEQFREGMKNHSAIYNALRRLIDRELLTHDEQAGTYALANENEAPSGKAAGASEAREGATSLIENQPALRLIG